MRRFLAARTAALVAGAVAQAVWIAALARHVGPAEFGIFGQVIAIGAVASAALSFGLGAYSLRYPDLGKPEISSMYVIRILVLLLVSAGLLIGFGPEGSEALLVIGIAYVCVEQMSDLTQGVLSGQRRQYVASGLLVAQRFAPLVGLGVGAAQGNLLMGLGVGLWVAILPSLVVWVAHFATPSRIISMLRGARAYWAASLASNIGQLDVVAVRHAAGLTNAGLYAASIRMVAPISLITNALLNVLVPELARRSRHERDRAFRIALRWTALMSGVVILASPLIVMVATWILGPAYEDATLFMTAFVIAGALSTISRVHQSYLYAVGGAGWVAIVVAVSALCGIAAILVLGSLYGAWGVAVVPVAVQLAILAALDAAVRRDRRVNSQS